MEYRKLVCEFASGLGVPEITFDEDGIASLAADDMVISFMEVPELRSILIWAKVATLPPENLTQLYRMLLEAMFMGRATQGATFSCEDDAIYLHRMDGIEQLDPDGLGKIVEDFLNLIEKWRAVIGAFRADESRTAGVGDEPKDLGLDGISGFMAV